MMARATAIARISLKRIAPAIAAAMLTVAWAGSATAQQQAPKTKCDDKTALGVERIVEVDTTDGPRLGHVQYKDIDFLEPGEVVLTFDDGPSPQTTPAVLEALASHCTRATFFMVGRMAIAAPELTREVADKGHTIASHTWSHKNLGSLGRQNAEREIELGLSAITAALGKPIAPFFRFPYLSDPRGMIAHLEGRNQAIMSIDVDSYDWRARSRSVMHNNVLSQLEKRGKGIILFHDIQRVTASSLGALLDELHRRKFKVVHLVPKKTAPTLAEYDALAAKELARRRIAVADKPLSPRAVVWPMTGGEPAETVKRPAAQETLPWNEPAKADRAVAVPDNRAQRPPNSTATSRTARPPRPVMMEDLPWHEQMWQHYR